VCGGCPAGSFPEIRAFWLEIAKEQITAQNPFGQAPGIEILSRTCTGMLEIAKEQITAQNPFGQAPGIEILSRTCTGISAGLPPSPGALPGKTVFSAS
jgi:hypothetical protein